MRFIRDQLDGRTPALAQRALWLLADLAVLRKLRQRLGLDRARIALSAAAPIAPQMIAFFRALGIPLLEAYGQTETGVTVLTPAEDVRLGAVGQILPGVEFHLSDEGEVLCKGPGLLQGYLKNEEATAKAFTDGFFNSGDQGDFDQDGYLSLTGRTKDMIITSAGRNIAPQNIEIMLCASDYILDAILVGDGRPHLTALIALDEETVSRYAQTHSIPFASHADLAEHPQINRLIDDEIQTVNRRWSDREQILDFRIMRWELSSDDDELTTTGKVRRAFLQEQFADLIEEMYADV